MLDRARDAYERREWVTAREAFARASDDAPLAPDDLYALASCAWWLGDLDTALPLQRQAYQHYLEADRIEDAALVAIDHGYTLSIRGDEAQGSGWIARASRLLEDRTPCIQHGYLDHLDFEAAFERSDLVGAMDAARRVHALGRRLGHPTLCALGVVGQGRVLVRRGDVATGVPLLDEAMLAAVTEDLEPGWAGNIYCHLMVACDEIADLRRAGEWTRATAQWCESMPGAGPFMGICRVHRARILQGRGAWDDAEREARHVCDELTDMDVIVAAEAHYLLGELKLRRGDLAAAEAEFREGHRLGRDPEPGLALLRLARGDAEGAATAIRSALTAAGRDQAARNRLLPAAVEVAVAVGDLDDARAWAEEIEEVASTYGTDGFATAALHARGAVLLADDDPAGAVAVLRQATDTARDLDLPFEVAQLRLLSARAYERLGDAQAASLERDAATSDLARLGARGPDGGASGPVPRDPAGLTRREVEVLGLVATGRSNQEVAARLVLSVRTVERHLATVYRKLGVQGPSARVAAVSFAIREGIVERP